MKYECHPLSFRRFLFLSSLSAMLLLSVAGLNAAQDPPGCTANNLNVNIGVTANNVTNGTVVTWFVTVQNPNLPTSCAVTLGSEGLFFLCPGPDGNPTGAKTVLIPGGTRISPGFGPQVFEIPCLVNVSGMTAEGKVSAPGSVVHKNPLQDDPANVDKTISVNVFRPCLQLSSTCVSAINQNGNSVTVTYTGTVGNCGNVLLQQVVVYADQPGAGTLVFGPVTLPAGATTNFTASYTRTDNLCGPFVTVLTASGTAPLDVPVILTKDASSQCSIGYQPAIRVNTFCPPQPVQPGGLLTISGVVSNAGNIALRDVFVRNTKPAAGNILLGPITLGVGESVPYSGSYNVPPDSCPPYVDTVSAQGVAICGEQTVTSQAAASCPGANNPSIVVTKVCPPPVEPGGTLNYSGTVVNTGNITLNNVIVVSDKPVANTRVFGPAVLAPGAEATFTGSYKVPADSCGPYTSTLVATGRDKCFSVNVTNAVTVDCPGTSQPSIRVARNCPTTPVQPGSILSYSGSVTNTGNITLNNVTVRDGETVVYGPATLAPKARGTFTGSYTVPLDSCGPYVGTLVATASSLCGEGVGDTVTVSCASTNTPGIKVTKACPVNPVVPGESLVFTGTVTNTGNITLTNVVVVNNMPAAGTVVFGPADLAPGAGAAFAGSYVVPVDSCGPYSDTVVATGADKCFGKVVSSTATTSCPGISSPAIAITQECPPNPTPIGGTMTFTAHVSNTGNITLTDIIVVNDKPSAGTVVLRVASLAPGASTNFTAGFTVPASLDACSIANTLAVTGKNKCNTQTVAASVTKICPVTSAPGIEVTKICPATPPSPGGVQTFTGSVRNTGNVTLSNVTVVVNRPAAGTVVYTAASLAAGATASFTGSYTVPQDDCSVTDTVTATAVDRCGNPVSDSKTTTCPILTTPMVAISRTCPEAPVAPGAEMGLFGWITNSGNVTLTNVTLVVDRPEPNTLFFGPVTLAPGASAGYVGSFTVPTNLGACTVASTVTVRGNNKCTGAAVSANSTLACPVVSTPKIMVTKSCPPTPPAQGTPMVFTGTVVNAGDITLTNIVVVNTQPVSNTVVFTASQLLPGQSTNFTASYTTPGDCCSVCDTLTATGQDFCTGKTVRDTATQICPVQFAPAVRITKVCPTVAVAPGESMVYSGTVINAGNITLSDVVVYNSMTGAQNPILGLAALVPGEEVPFTASYIVPEDFCEPDTVTVTALSICGEVPVQHSVTSPCPVLTTPAIVLENVAAVGPVEHGQMSTFAGRVRNAGNVTLHNVTVANILPVPGTPVLGPVTLKPGQSTNFTHTYLAVRKCNCCEVVNSFTARGQDRCESRQVMVTSTIVTPYVTHPQVIVALECPPEATPGQVLNVPGTVMNNGDITLTNVVVVSEAGPGAGQLLGPISLAPGEIKGFQTSYTSGGYVRVAATALDPCTGAIVTDQDFCGQTIPTPIIGKPSISREGVVLSWTSMAGVTYRVQSCPDLPGGTWVNEPGDVLATGSLSSKTLSLNAASGRRFYRVLAFRD